MGILNLKVNLIDNKGSSNILKFLYNKTFLLNGEEIGMASSVTRKNRQMSKKVAQNDFTRKLIDFDTFTIIA